MQDLPTHWSGLCAVVLLLGIRHGLDADHLAAIDGITRLNHGEGQRLARWCGALFSLGHGVVVVSIAVAVGGLSRRWSPPDWLEAAGGWISIAFLTVIGLANLHVALRAAHGAVVGLVGVKGALFGRLVNARSPWAAAAVGALFAVSFDTLGQVAVMAVAASSFGGVPHALALAALFVLGMVLVDGLNGWWVAHLISRADRHAARASRIMAFAVAAFSLGVAALGTAQRLAPLIAPWPADGKWLLGVAVGATLAAALLVARRGRPREPARA